jgi:hypothetical protein
MNHDELLPLIRVYPSLIDYIDTQTPFDVTHRYSERSTDYPVR